MAVTILEAAKNYDGDPIKQGVIEQFSRSSDLLRVLPFENQSGAGVKAKREDTLPNIAFRGVNGSYTEGTGVLEEIDESLKIIGGDLDVDKFIVKTMGERQRAVQTAMKVKAAALKMTQTIFKGDVQSDPKGLDGFQVRLGATAGDQVINAGTTSGGDALSLLKMDELSDSVDEPNVWLMNKTMRRRLTVAARTPAVGGNIDYAKDEFGRQITTYNGLPIIIIDKDNENNQILPFTEANPGGGSAASTSIYCAHFGEGMLTGIQTEDMDVEDLGELDSSPVFRTRVEWYINFVIWHSRAISRLNGIKDAVVTV